MRVSSKDDKGRLLNIIHRLLTYHRELGRLGMSRKKMNYFQRDRDKEAR